LPTEYFNGANIIDLDSLNEPEGHFCLRLTKRIVLPSARAELFVVFYFTVLLSIY